MELDSENIVEILDYLHKRYLTQVRLSEKPEKVYEELKASKELLSKRDSKFIESMINLGVIRPVIRA